MQNFRVIKIIDNIVLIPCEFLPGNYFEGMFVVYDAVKNKIIENQTYCNFTTDVCIVKDKNPNWYDDEEEENEDDGILVVRSHFGLEIDKYNKKTKRYDGCSMSIRQPKHAYERIEVIDSICTIDFEKGLIAAVSKSVIIWNTNTRTIHKIVDIPKPKCYRSVFKINDNKLLTCALKDNYRKTEIDIVAKMEY